MKKLEIKYKKILPILLVLIMVVQSFPLSAFATEGISWNVPERNAVVGEAFDLLANVTAVAEDGSVLTVEISDVTFTDVDNEDYVCNTTDTVITPESAGEYEVIYNAVNAEYNTVSDTYSRTVTVDKIEDTESGEETVDEPQIPESRGISKTISNAISKTTFTWHSSMGDGTYNGYVLSGDKLTIVPSQNTEQKAMLQINFALTNGSRADVGEIEIRIPQSIFNDSIGNPVGDFYLPLSMSDEGITSFKYYIDSETNEIVITNYKAVDGGYVFTCEMEYKVLPSDIEDSYIKDDISASFIYKHSDGTADERVTSDDLTVQIDTGASINSFEKAYALKYETWLPAWGTAPVDTADYFYVAWRMSYQAPDNCTEAYAVTFSENAGSNATVMGYCISPNTEVLKDESEISFVVDKPETNISTVKYYVIVAYDRSILNAEANPTIKNEITATLTEACGKTNTATASAQYKYQRLDLSYVGDSFYALKYSSGNNVGIINTIEKGDSAVLGMQRNAEKYSFQLESNARGWGLTKDDAGIYGEKEYTVDLIDESLSIDGIPLEHDDYEITSWWINYTEYAGIASGAIGGGYEFIENTDYTTYSPVGIYAKTVDGTGDWELIGEVIRIASGYHYTDKCGKTTDFSGSFSQGAVQIQLPEGAYAIRFSDTNSQYYVQIRAFFMASLNPTANVKNILDGKTNAELKNVVQQEVTNADEKLVRRSPASATMQLTKTVANSTLTKSSPTKVSNPAGYEILKYDITMYESTVYNPSAIAVDNKAALKKLIEDGIVAEQTNGTFYDLLPMGTVVDTSTISAVTYGNGAACTFAVDTIENWENSGQTMLIIKVTAPSGDLNYYDNAQGSNRILYSGFKLTYSLIYSWIAYHDYGGTLLNSIAYRSGTGSLGDGDTAASSTIKKKQYFSDLDNDGADDDNNENTIYAQNSSLIIAVSAAEAGFNKAVKAADESIYGKSSVSPAVGTYTYQLRYGTDSAIGEVGNLVFYDVLESYDSGDSEQWKGTFIEVDTSYAKSKGIDAIVYYSTASGLNPENTPGEADLTDGTIWSTTPPADLSTVTAVAVDMSRNQDGTDRVFKVNEVASCYITMRAPADYERWEGVYAYNSAYCGLTFTSNSGSPMEAITECNNVKVGLRDADIKINKSSIPASGTATAPTTVIVGDTIEYTVSVENTNVAAALEKVEITDIIPDGLTIDESEIQYYVGTDAGTAKLISEANGISVAKTNQTLIFTIDKLLAGEAISFIIPAGIVSYGTVFENTAIITKINGYDFEINSETTYHKTGNQFEKLQLTGIKNLTGKTLEDNMFSFAVTDENGEIAATGTNKADGTINFSEIEYTVAGDHTYTVTEVNGGLGGITYDSKSYTVTVKVVDNGDGTLTATETIPTGGIVFDNSYTTESTSITLTGTKNLTGRTLTDEMFSFVVKEGGTTIATGTNQTDGTINFGAIEYTTTGDHTYTVSEVNGGAGGITYDSKSYTVTVKVVDNGDGTLSATPTYSDGDIAFTNSYNTESTVVTLTGKKTLTGKTLTDGLFSFIVTDEDDQTVATGTNKADGTITFGEIGFTTAGTYTYTVSEVNGGAGGITYDNTLYTVTVEVVDNGDGTLTAAPTYLDGEIAFTNSYTTGSTTVTLNGQKTLTGKTLTDGLFSFIVTNNDGKVVATGTNKADGTITFGKIGFSAPGTYTYTVREANGGASGITYDNTLYTVTVEVVDNGDGTLTATPTYPDGGITFANSYVGASTTITLSGKKTLTGKTLTDGLFSFIVTDKDGKTVSTGTNKADGKITFGEIGFTAAGTYTYTVKEVNGGEGGITYDSTSYTVTVEVVDKGNGTLKATVSYSDGSIEFNNSYSPESTMVTLIGTKNLTGMTLIDDMFSFAVIDENWNIVATATNKADGSITFSDISFLKVGSYTYTVSEINGGISGISYDDTEYKVTVEVEDNGDGTLKATVSYPDGSIEFNNSYSPYSTQVSPFGLKGSPFSMTDSSDGTVVTLMGTKNLTGKTLKDNMFSFVVKDESGNTVATAANKADGTIAFGEIGLTAAGTYTYTVTEVNNSASGITYDKTVYTVTVTVVDNGDGTLTATITYPDSGVVFHNTYSTGSTTTATTTTTTTPKTPEAPTTTKVPKTTKAPTTTGSLVKTGDTSSVWVWIALLCASLTGVVCLLWMVRRRNRC